MNQLRAILAQSPGVSPNEGGLPGLDQARTMAGALLTWALVIAVAALVVSSVVWAFSSNSGNAHYAARGKTGVLIAAGAAVLVGGANAIIEFFAGVGQGI